MKLLYAAIALLGMTLSAMATDLTKEVLNPSVQIEMPQVGFCSGQLIHSAQDEKTGDVSTFILTAKHCTKDIKDGNTVIVRFERHDKGLMPVSNEDYFAKVWGQSYKSDVALLKLTDKDTFFPDVAAIAPKGTVLTFAEPVITAGYPMSGSLTYTQGNLGYKEKYDGVFDELSTSHVFQRATPNNAPGSSGTALYAEVDGKYQIIGTLTAGYAQYPFLELFTPLDEIQAYLEEASKASDWIGPKTEDKSDKDVVPGTRH